ncbi:MAG: hypothetical protein B6I38_03880 [Anaerolineaceae bacterium 4572_5.1]|nr:MAG: hypothetical protein B6I38_03880 [Anaerolineaceae bacterium 4572_5.1]
MNEDKRPWLERPIHPALPAISNEVLVFGVILILAFLSRFYDLGTRVMSHDESLHTYFSWLLYKGQGYQHTPMMHGPLQFHLLALSYYLFGVSDFTARIPAALFSIAMIWMLWYWRRYLGKAGALIAGLLMLISPYMLFYGRYVRNEAFSGFAGLLMIYVVLRYLESGEKRYLYWLTISLLINFTAKETAFIYTAQALLFLAFYFIRQIVTNYWGNDTAYRAFIISLSVGVLLLGAALGAGVYAKNNDSLTAIETAAPADPFAPQSPISPAASGSLSLNIVFAGVALLAFLAAAYFLIRGYGWEKIRAERSFDLLILTGTIVLPMLTPFISKLFGWTIPSTAPELSALTSVEIAKLAIAIVLTKSPFTNFCPHWAFY